MSAAIMDADTFAQQDDIGMREALLFERLASCNLNLKTAVRLVAVNPDAAAAQLATQIDANELLFKEIDACIRRFTRCKKDGHVWVGTAFGHAVCDGCGTRKPGI